MNGEKNINVVQIVFIIINRVDTVKLKTVACMTHLDGSVKYIKQENLNYSRKNLMRITENESIIKFCLETMHDLLEHRKFEFYDCDITEDDEYMDGYKHGYFDLINHLQNLLDCGYIQESYDDYTKNEK